MYPTRVTWQRRFRSLLPYMLLVVVLAGGLIALDRAHTATSASLAPQDAQSRGVINAKPCGTQLGFAGYSVALSTAPNAARTLRTSLGLASSDLAPEFLPLTSAAPALPADPAARQWGLDRMQVVRAQSLGQLSTGAVVAKLQSAAGVGAVEPIWLQSSDKRYLSCDYKLKDNPTDQALAATARQALITRGVSAASLDDAGTMEYVSLRHFAGRELLQVAFVRRPVGAPSVAYVVLLGIDTPTVLATARADWYRWEP
ncbi:MAG: hypothetical protein IVW57_14240 [Ktedonobacterales bacterium]|nr:hypothetical protein [Ktedonobacterales bacterium]